MLRFKIQTPDLGEGCWKVICPSVPNCETIVSDVPHGIHHIQLAVLKHEVETLEHRHYLSGPLRALWEYEIQKEAKGEHVNGASSSK